ncbi:omptin family outer membrane protease [Pseudomonas caspiana]
MLLKNGRKTLLLFTALGLSALGQQAFADARVTNEQRLKVGSVDLSLGLGLLNGRSQEKVYDDGEKLSQLTWDIKQVPTLHLGLAFHPLDWLSYDLRGWTRISGGNSHMKDYDWLSDEDVGWTHYSDHPKTRLKNAWQVEFAATARALKREDLSVGVTAGYQRSRFDWDSKGGSYTYSSENGLRDREGSFPDGLKVISYQQTYDTPYLGLVGLYNLHNWTLESRFKYSNWVRSRDFDNHHLRATTFSSDNGNTGRMQSLALGLTYNVNRQLSVKAGIDHQVYTSTKGNTLIKDAFLGWSGVTEPKSSAQTNRTTMTTLAVAYQF